MKPHHGTLILILGILSLFMCSIFTGIPAWVMANSDLREMDAGTMDPSGRGATQAGKVCGIISVVLAVLCMLLVIAMFVLGFGFFALHQQQG
ncbi:MAG TPA: DUF4190 domain-containing protein [Verrucomicrobiae bacterium]|nr:DUF4190 domain-containing protein [Verrucomicrobiae bacterium]